MSGGLYDWLKRNPPHKWSQEEKRERRRWNDRNRRQRAWAQYGMSPEKLIKERKAHPEQYDEKRIAKIAKKAWDDMNDEDQFRTPFFHHP